MSNCSAVLPGPTTNCHTTVRASARHSGEVIRALVQKVEQNGILER